MELGRILLLNLCSCLHLNGVCGDGELILDYSGEYNVIRRMYSTKEGRQVRGRYDKESRIRSDGIALRGHKTKNAALGVLKRQGTRFFS